MISLVTDKEKISPRVIERLTRYLRCLENLSPDDYISSEEMAERMGLTAAQIRKDLSNFISDFGEGFGVRGKGYQVRILYSGIEKILGVHKTNNIIIIGAGRLGGALLAEPEFTKESFNVIGVFDVAEYKVGKEVNGIKIRHTSEIEYFLNTKDRVDIAILTVPKGVAQDIATTLIKAGVKSFLNFAPLKLEVPEDVVVSNIDLYGKLQELNYWKEKVNQW
ncbi:redox-sensing transcriptional repressor Rex [Ilyobacter polytropus]|uniref:Redox-sensing transcriptional repressor Rex n=1 Tax=Ilyobacter polytropus (strain ATCC 51220 / DSM 2926 / LMG 16218 / CuHBu1) TaxID=572544 RepID=E3H6U3_ILYPC|nr:redox-sensing transcriptional repressor Rex [Ilyobacter polytropus]ADO82462.1 CoA-binding domain protein [Ilyobacter polytropus DSM 2926]